MESDNVGSSGLTVRRVPCRRCAAVLDRSQIISGKRHAPRRVVLLTLRKPARNPVNLEATTEDGWLEGKGRRKSRCHPRWIPGRDNTTRHRQSRMGHRCRPSREEGGPEAPGDQWWRHLLIKETRNDPARRATPCPSRYQNFRSLLIGFINRFGGVSVVTEGSFGVHDSGEKDMRFMA